MRANRIPGDSEGGCIDCVTVKVLHFGVMGYIKVWFQAPEARLPRGPFWPVAYGKIFVSHS